MGLTVGPLVGILAQAVALACIGLLATTTTPYIALLPAFILAGLGMGFTFGPVSSVVMNSATVLVGASIVAVGGLLMLLLRRAVPVSSTGEVLQEIQQEVEKLPAA